MCFLSINIILTTALWVGTYHYHPCFTGVETYPKDWKPTAEFTSLLVRVQGLQGPDSGSFRPGPQTYLAFEDFLWGNGPFDFLGTLYLPGQWWCRERGA